jgi:hypothetical protein
MEAMDLASAIVLRDFALAAYTNALGARSETVGDTQVVHQDISRLADELSRWENVVAGLQTGVSDWRIRTPKWTS